MRQDPTEKIDDANLMSFACSVALNAVRHAALRQFWRAHTMQEEKVERKGRSLRL